MMMMTICVERTETSTNKNTLFHHRIIAESGSIYSIIKHKALNSISTSSHSHSHIFTMKTRVYGFYVHEINVLRGDCVFECIYIGNKQTFTTILVALNREEELVYPFWNITPKDTSNRSAARY